MAHALDNCSHTSVCAELGITRGNDRTQTSLTRHASINKWSFYRSGSISANAGTKLIELTAPTSDDKLGDFRGYNHNALTPYLFDGYPDGLGYGPGGSSFDFTTIVYLEELNVRELTSGSVPYIIIKYYPSLTDRTNGTNLIKTTSTLVSESSVTPPVGHTNNQTAKPASASQIILDTFLVSDIPGANVVYIDVYIGNNGGSTIYGRFGSSISDSYDDVTIYENQYPFVDACWGNYSPVPPDYGGNSWTFVAIVVTNSSSAKDGADFQEANGSNTYGTFYWYVYGLCAGIYYRIGNCSVTAQLQGDIATTTIFNGTLNSASSTSNQSASGSLSSGNWAYNDEADVVLTAATWTGYDVYSLGASAPSCL